MTTVTRLHSLSRTTLTARLAAVAIVLSTPFAFLGCTGQPSRNDDELVVRIGYQKAGTLALAKQRGELEKTLTAQGIRVSWTEFPAGPLLLEAMNVGSVDFGHAGDSPPIFAQAAGVPFVYVAASAPSPSGSAILVRADSNLQRLEDLKGKKIAFAKGSSANYLVLTALAKAGLSIDDVEPVHLIPSDARAAFTSGAVDAWSIWDPYFAAAEYAGDVRVLVDGADLVSGREYYLAARSFATAHPGLIKDLVAEIERAGAWAQARPSEVAQVLASELGLDVAVLERAERRRGRHGVRAIDAELIAEQQSVAAAYLQAGLIPRSIQVSEAVFNPLASRQ